MLNSFRTGGANHPETFVTAIAATLARYPDEVIFDVTDPRTGLPSKLEFMPSIKAVYEACEAAELPIKTRREREERIAKQLEERKREDEERAKKPSYAELKAKYGENWGLTIRDPKRESTFKAPSWQGIASMYSADPSRIQRLMKNDLMGHHDDDDNNTTPQEESAIQSRA